MHRRLMIIGLAEATLDLIEPWAKAGRLPAFKLLMDEGVCGRLRSRVPMITPQMWGTLLTGLNPGYHGLYDFWQRDPDGIFREVNGSFLKARPVWQILSGKGIKCGIVNMPCTYPPQKFNGFMISGQDAPGEHSSIAEPRVLYKKIMSKFGSYRFKDVFPGGREKSDYLTLIPENVSHQTEILKFLLKDQPWDFFLTFFSATAMAQHYFWSDMKEMHSPFKDVIFDAYRAIDKSLAELIKSAGSQTDVFVISECGAGPLKSGVQINTWLEKEGFLVRKKRRAGRISQWKIIVENIRKGVQKNLPKNFHFWLNRYLKPVRKWAQSYLTSSDICWEKTCAFSRGKEGEIYINLRGRDRHGIVSPEDYESLRNQIQTRLMQLVDPATGLSAVGRVFGVRKFIKGLIWNGRRT